MATPQSQYETLDQYDYAVNDDFDIEEIEQKFAELIGKFIINFNSLENRINICIAEIIQQGTHEFGFQIVEKLSMNSKIELFHKLYFRFVSIANAKQKAHLRQIKTKLNELNTFRNTIVHGNWALYNKKGYIRSKIVIDSEEGGVKFELRKIYKKDIAAKIKEAFTLAEELFELYSRYEQEAFGQNSAEPNSSV